MSHRSENLERYTQIITRNLSLKQNEQSLMTADKMALTNLTANSVEQVCRTFFRILSAFVMAIKFLLAPFPVVWFPYHLLFCS